MKPTEIIRRRLANQHLAGKPLSTPLEVVSAQGALQAQDFYGALWALAQRLPAGWTESAVEAWFADGRILRTHILRPTWHFVAPEDLGWMLLLSAPRVNAFNAYMYRQHGIDTATQKRSLKALQRSLEGGRQLMRKELAEALEDSGIPIGSGAPGSIRLAHIIMFAELAGLITSGPRRGKQFTYMLLDERAPAARRLPARAEALAELARRYFGARGPASAHDFAWWSGLTLADCRAAAQAAGLHSTELDGKTYWWSKERAPARSVRGAWLLPNLTSTALALLIAAILSRKHTSRSGRAATTCCPISTSSTGARRGCGSASWASKRYASRCNRPLVAICELTPRHWTGTSSGMQSFWA